MWALRFIHQNSGTSIETPSEKSSDGIGEQEKILRVAMEGMLPEFVKSRQETGDSLVIHRDAFAADYNEYELLGIAIKFAGLYGKELQIVGKNRETPRAAAAN
jgi:hypothetical protein